MFTRTRGSTFFAGSGGEEGENSPVDRSRAHLIHGHVRGQRCPGQNGASPAQEDIAVWLTETAVSDLPGAAPRCGADYAMISTTSGG